MALFTNEVKRLGLKKESVRGTPEAAPDKWRAITADSVLDYVRTYVEDETKRGIAAMFPAAAGITLGTGTIKFPVRASDIGEFLHMCLGDPVSVLDSASLAFKHTWTIPIVGNQKQAYTLFMDRGLDVHSYDLSQVSQLTFSGDGENPEQMEAAMLFKKEIAGASIGSPDYTGESEELMSFDADCKIAGSSSIDVKTHSFVINPNMQPLRSQNKSTDIRDVIARQLQITGTNEIYFSSQTERDKFIAGTQTAMELLLEGALIEDTSKETLQILVPKVTYRAFPLGELDELLGASVEWTGEYDIVSAKLAEIIVINRIASY